jgi:hypothetical protein
MNLMGATSGQQAVSRFVQFSGQEPREREFFITICKHGRFGLRELLLCIFIIPIFYFLLRRLKITRGYATITRDRLIYYEHCDHAEENYHWVQQVATDSISAVMLGISKSWLHEEFVFTVWTDSALALAVGAQGNLLQRLLGKADILEPGPEADEFVQQLAALVTTMRIQKRQAAA